MSGHLERIPLIRPTSSLFPADDIHVPPALTYENYPPSDFHLTYRRRPGADQVFSFKMGKPLNDALAISVQDRTDRIFLAWPCRPDNGLVLAALHLLEGRVKGNFVSRTIGLWPWRNGINRGSKSILVEPETLARYGLKAAQERLAGAEWTKKPFGCSAHEMVCIRLEDLKNAPPKHKEEVVVRFPTLFEMTSIFPPLIENGPYAEDSDHILSRIRKYTHIGDKKLTLSHVNALGNPELAPTGIFGLPADEERLLTRCLTYPRFVQAPMDAIVVDLTSTSVKHMGDHWGAVFERFLGTLERLGSRRPGIVVLTKDGVTFRRAARILRKSAKDSFLNRPLPDRQGILLSTPSLVGWKSGGKLVVDGTPVVRADMKDARLLGLRKEVLDVARDIEASGDPDAAAALRGGFNFVRSVVNLPVALDDAKRIAEALYCSEEAGDQRARSRFFPVTALQGMKEQAARSIHGKMLLAFALRFIKMAESWANATPVSEKLASLARQMGDRSKKAMLVLPTAQIARIYALSGAAASAGWLVANPDTMHETSKAHGCEHWIVVSPSHDTMKALLIFSPCPVKLDFLGDAAGTAMMVAELKTLMYLDAFRPLHARAQAFLAALDKSMENLVLEVDEEEWSARTYVAHQELDFTKSDGDFKGDKIRIRTQRGHFLLYRPNSEVLRHTPDDISAFDRVSASDIQASDTILVLTDELMSLLRKKLSRAPKTMETLRLYHTEVARRRDALPGATLKEKAQKLLATIRYKNPLFTEKELPNLMRWLNVDGSTMDRPSALPSAPRDRLRFRWFMEGLKADPAIAEVCWTWGVRQTRSYRQSEGMHFNQRAVGFVMDPESFSARSGGLDAAALQQAIMENTDTVLSVETIDATR